MVISGFGIQDEKNAKFCNKVFVFDQNLFLQLRFHWREKGPIIRGDRKINQENKQWCNSSIAWQSNLLKSQLLLIFVLHNFEKGILINLFLCLWALNNTRSRTCFELLLWPAFLCVCQKKVYWLRWSKTVFLLCLWKHLALIAISKAERILALIWGALYTFCVD